MALVSLPGRNKLWMNLCQQKPETFNFLNDTLFLNGFQSTYLFWWNDFQLAWPVHFQVIFPLRDLGISGQGTTPGALVFFFYIQDLYVTNGQGSLKSDLIIGTFERWLMIFSARCPLIFGTPDERENLDRVSKPEAASPLWIIYTDYASCNGSRCYNKIILLEISFLRSYLQTCSANSCSCLPTQWHFALFGLNLWQLAMPHTWEPKLRQPRLEIS